MGEIRLRLREGGEGSGNFDHSGRPGEVGGSAPGKGGGGGGGGEKKTSLRQKLVSKAKSAVAKARENAWRKEQIKADREYNREAGKYKWSGKQGTWTSGEFRQVHGKLVRKSELKRYKSPWRVKSASS